MVSSASTTIVPSQKNNVLGFGFQVLSIILFLGMDILVTMLVEAMPLYEVIFYRNATGIPFLLLYVYATGKTEHLRITRPVLHLVRAMVGGVAMTCFFAGFKYLPFAENSAIIYVTPIVITIFSVIFLREKIYAHRSFALIVGFIGTMVIVRPSGDFNIYYILPIGSAITFAIVILLVHKITKFDSPISITLTFSTFMTLATGAICLYYGFSPIMGIHDIAYILCIGNLGMIAQVLSMWAIKSCDVNFFAVTKYLGLLGSASIGVFIFNDTLTVNLTIGMGMIMFSGLYITWREHVRQKKERLKLQLRA